MRFRRLHDWVYYSLVLVQWAVAFVVAGIGQFSRPVPPGGSTVTATLSAWSGRAAPYALLLGGVFAIAQAVRVIMGPPRMWRALQGALGKFRDHVFRDVPHKKAYHRVTLFQRVRCKWWMWPFRSTLWPWGVKRRRKVKWLPFEIPCLWWPWSGWIVPCLRHPVHTTQASRTVFLAPDDPDYAEGVAGQAWSENTIVEITGLPEIRPGASDEAIGEYAERAFVSSEWVKDRLEESKPLPRSLYGVPVEVRHSLYPWGVIVIDSPDPTLVGENPAGRASRPVKPKASSEEIQELYRLVGVFLGKMIEGG